MKTYYSVDATTPYRFSRRLGEQVPDAQYAEWLEGPQPSALNAARAMFWGTWLGLILAVGATLVVLAFRA
jgi:hypothetical protein